MKKNKVAEQEEADKSPEVVIDKRPWLMDWLFEIGQDLAIINHCNEKIEYLGVEIENALDEAEVDKIAQRMDGFYQLKQTAYDGYNLKMTYIFESIPEAEKDTRCILKHACNRITLAMETDDTLNNGMSQMNLRNAFRTFSSGVSLALGVEFTDCVRCLYDGVSNAAKKSKEYTSI